MDREVNNSHLWSAGGTNYEEYGTSFTWYKGFPSFYD